MFDKESGNNDNPLSVKELLYDLKHDLGKYVQIPVAMLPDNAGKPEIKDALNRALYKTRIAGGKVQSAEQIWQDYHNRLLKLWDDKSALSELETAVLQILGLAGQFDTFAENNKKELKQHLGETLAGISITIDRLLLKIKD